MDYKDEKVQKYRLISRAEKKIINILLEFEKEDKLLIIEKIQKLFL